MTGNSATPAPLTCSDSQCGIVTACLGIDVEKSMEKLSIYDTGLPRKGEILKIL